MTPNNLCRTLIVYGSYAPGNPNHHCFADLPGTWRKGKILAHMLTRPDGIGPGECDVVEAWTIEFDDCHAEMFTPGWENQRKSLHRRWTTLDATMGPAWARTERRWWPENSDPMPSDPGMIVVNIYVPLEHFPYLASQNDIPSPDDEDDIFELWRQQKEGEKDYDSGVFIGLIKDSLPADLPEQFGDLPRGAEFVSRLSRFFEDHLLSSGNLLCGDEDSFYLYVWPLQRNALPPSQLVELARADIAQHANLLRSNGRAKDANALAALRFEFGEPVDDSSWSHDDPGVEALDSAADLCLELVTSDEPWFYCLSEACYGLAASFALRDWLMSVWYQSGFDFTPAYLLWKAGGKYSLKDGVCVVYEVERRLG